MGRCVERYGDVEWCEDVEWYGEVAEQAVPH